MATVVLGITGSIAAYKAADIASQLVKNQHSVHCVCTPNSLEFVTAMTLQTLSRNPIISSLQDEKSSWKPGHIDLADSADLFVVAPATANTIGNFANGLAPDCLSSIYLATRAPVLICPAMNGKMWNQTAVQANVEKLKQCGVSFFGPEKSGILACGYEGEGRLMPIDEIVREILARLKS